jgi:hypothetical protein
MSTRVDRRTVDLSSYPDLVVIYLGMRVNRITGIKTLLGFGPQISASAAAQPDGLLRHETIVYSVFPMNVGMRQYWRDVDSLLKWTRSDPHRRCGKSFSETREEPASGTKPISGRVGWKLSMTMCAADRIHELRACGAGSRPNVRRCRQGWKGIREPTRPLGRGTLRRAARRVGSAACVDRRKRLSHAARERLAIGVDRRKRLSHAARERLGLGLTDESVCPTRRACGWRWGLTGDPACCSRLHADRLRHCHISCLPRWPL